MIVFDGDSIRLEALPTFFFLYVGMVGLYTWRIARIIQSHRLAVRLMRLRYAQAIARASR